MTSNPNRDRCTKRCSIDSPCNGIPEQNEARLNGRLHLRIGLAVGRENVELPDSLANAGAGSLVVRAAASAGVTRENAATNSP